jgi:ParB family chromosome partitioning protein
MSVPVNLIRSNGLLAATVTPPDVERWAELIQQHGPLAPVVVRAVAGGYMVVAGEPELEAVRHLHIQKTHAVVVGCASDTEAHKLSLQLLSLRRCSNHLEEALIIKEVLKDPQVSQTDLAKACGHSVSWVNKRLSLVSALTSNVVDLVACKQLSPTTAQEIAKLPRIAQHKFAVRVVTDKLPKSTVEKLVSLYNSPDTTAGLRQQILMDPSDVFAQLAKGTTKLTQPMAKKEDKQFEKACRLLRHVLDQLLALFTQTPITQESEVILERIVTDFLHKLRECSQDFPQGKEMEAPHAN